VGTADGVIDELIGFVIETAAVPSAQQLAVAAHHPQRLLEVMGDNACELLEITVGARELI
jgi:hypothetical protein